MQVIIHIQNNLLNDQEVVLFDAMFADGKFSGQGITGTVDVIDDKNNNRTIDFHLLVQQTNHIPYEVKITETSNNRQIDFYRRTYDSLRYGHKYKGKPYLPMEPGLTKDGKKRKERWSVKDDCFKYSPEWNEHEWNIADTHELFILDNKVVFELRLKPKEKFSIYVDVTPKSDFNKHTYTGPTITKQK